MARVWLLLVISFSVLRKCQAIPWLGAMETPMGIMATVGMSPRPTEAPGLKGLPKELMPRQNVQYPPPDNWCGFVDGAYSNPLTCSSNLKCIHSDTAIGCCSSVDSACTALYTGCVNYGDTCNAACQRDSAIVSCIGQIPYCGTYSFAGGSYLYNCQTSIQILVDSVEYLADYYLTAIGSTLTTFASTSDTYTRTSGSGSGSGSGSTSTSTASPSTSDHTSTSTGLSSAAIGGIAAGAGLVICAVLGLIIWFCLRSRKRARLAASQQNVHHAPPAFNPQQSPPPMQQQPQQTGYQTVPQQDSPMQGNSQYQPTQAGYFGGPTDPGKDNGPFTHVSPIGSPSPSNVEPIARPFSAVSSPHPGEGGQIPQSLSPPLPGYAGPLANGAAQEYYKTPSSPGVTEVDGTQGNPGVPHGQRPAFNEVDGTQGNPGVPYPQQRHQGPYEMH